MIMQNYYLTKIEECEREETAAIDRGDMDKARYWEREARSHTNKLKALGAALPNETLPNETLAGTV